MKNDKKYRLSFTKKAKELVSQMTLEEKVYLMSGQIDLEKELPTILAPTVESHYNNFPYPAGGNDRLNVPKVLFCDGPRGVVCKQSTCFPVTMARGATFDTELEEEVGEVIGKEIRAHKGNFFGGVCINLPYNPGWGRSQEVYGEDSFHLGQMGKALVKGVQKHNVIACIKHYAFNSMENARFKVSVETDKRTEREVFLSHFKECIDAGAAAVMSSYNLYQGKHCGHNKYLLTDVLKKEWDFDGFIVSDFVWGIRDTVEAANAGLDIEMCNTAFYGEKLVKAVRDGLVPESVIDDAALRIVRTVLAFTSQKDTQEYPIRLVSCKEHTDLALKVAEKSMTLIQNRNRTLPFSKEKTKKLAVIGRLANESNTGDKGSSNVFPQYLVTPLQGLKSLLMGSEVLFDDGNDPKKAAFLAKTCDAVVIIAGYNHKDEGEYVVDSKDSGLVIGGDRKESLGLHKKDISLIKAVGKANKNTAVVLVGGNMILINEWKDHVPSILMSYYSGMEGGTAIAKTLFGDVNPGGKLPFVIPLSEKDVPAVAWESDHQEYGYYHGYAKLDKENKACCVPYGFGLSYTDFSISGYRLETDADSLKAYCTVRNIGYTEGDEVIQLYIGFSNSGCDLPVKKLLGFKRVTLKPGQSKEVGIICDFDRLKHYDPEKGTWQLDKMEYEAYLGTSSDIKDLSMMKFNVV
ncbi:MAG: glycoside hydrolase family 3 C-terminal domain-containing protein [Clostridia bacterium]